MSKDQFFKFYIAANSIDMAVAALRLVHAYDSGNAADFDISDPFMHPDHQVTAREISFRCRCDNEGTPYQVSFKSWFNFCIFSPSSQPISEQLLAFQWLNPPPTKKLLIHGYRPVFRFLDAQYKPLLVRVLNSQDAGTANHDVLLPSHKDVAYRPLETRCMGGSTDKSSQSLAFSIRIPKGTHIVQVSHSYPYPLNEVYARLDSLSKQWMTERIPLRDNVWLYKVYKDELSKQNPIIYISARCHPGETPGSYVLDGLLSSVELLLDKFQCWIVPAINAEGIRAGNYRADTKGNNLNRCYSKTEYPDLITADIIKLVTQNECNPGYLPDVYGPLKELMDPILKTKYFEQMGTFSGSSDADDDNYQGLLGEQDRVSTGDKIMTSMRNLRRSKRKKCSTRILGSDESSTEDTSDTEVGVEEPPATTSTSSLENATAFEISISNDRQKVRRIVKPARKSRDLTDHRSTSSDQSDRDAKHTAAKKPAPNCSAKAGAPPVAKTQSRGRLPPRSAGGGSGRALAEQSATSLVSLSHISSSPATLSSTKTTNPQFYDLTRDKAEHAYPLHQPTAGLQPIKYNKKPQIIFCLDIHSHASIPDCFLFGNSVFENGLPNVPKDKLFLGQLRNILFTSYLAGLDSTFNISKCDFKPGSMTKVDKAGETFEYTMRVGLYAETTLPTVYCFESHYYRKSRDYARKPFTVQDFLSMGSNLAKAIRSYYEFTPDKVLTYLKRLEHNIHIGYSAQKMLAELRQAASGDYLVMLYRGLYDQLDCQLNGALRQARRQAS